MKKKLLLYSLISHLFLFHSWAQKIPANQNKIDESPAYSSISSKIDNPTREILHYHVEEIMDKKFGGQKITYNISDPKLISTYPLLPNQTRIITPVYVEKKKHITKLTSVPLNKIESKLSRSNLQKKIATTVSEDKRQPNETILKLDAQKKRDPDKSSTKTDSIKKADYANIDIIKTYERLVDKGYATVEMLKKMGDIYFFNGELDKAEKSYSKLFSKTTTLEPEYYYRYAIALKSIGEDKKSEEISRKFNTLSSTKSKE